MCRLFGLIARRPVKITFPLLDAAESLRRQSLLNPDGWGVGYYAGGHAVVRKQPEAAHGSPGFSRVAEHARSHLFVAHVRLRTAGGINLANTHPFSYGGWILAPVSKWIQVAGLALLAYLFFTGALSPLVIIIVLLGMPVVFQRFQNRQLDAYLTSEPATQRYLMGAAWLGLVAYLAFFFVQTETMLGFIVR